MVHAIDPKTPPPMPLSSPEAIVLKVSRFRTSFLAPIFSTDFLVLFMDFNLPCGYIASKKGANKARDLFSFRGDNAIAGVS